MIRIIISGGGTGGHIFPAIAIADALRKKVPETDILFVGAQGRMEMERVPAAGYRIKGLPVSGFQRKLTWRNLIFPFRLLHSLFMARSIISDFKPDLVIGVGGYASGPVLRIATDRKIPTLIQEQNSYPGVTNRILAKKVSKICVAYRGMENYFPVDKTIVTGNPVRAGVVDIHGKKAMGLDYFNMSSAKKTILIIGGSLGAGTINRSILRFISDHLKSSSDHSGPTQNFLPDGIQILWQAGRNYFPEIREQLTAWSGNVESAGENPGGRLDFGPVHVCPFIERMDLAYAAADLIVSRAGAIAIAELCLIGKPVILVPSPNVAEDHQTRNAMALVEAGAALMIRDSDAESGLGITMLSILKDEAQQVKLGKNITALGIQDADSRITAEALELLNIPREGNPGNSLHLINIDRLQKIYFLGIGGIGMSALARYFLKNGVEIHGYDRTRTPLTDQLASAGIKIHFSEDVRQIPSGLDLAIYTPAIPSGHKEFQYLSAFGTPLKKRAEVLGMISRNYPTVAVAGTHGKTTTSTLIAHMLRSSDRYHLAFLGGISKNYDSNFLCRLPEPGTKQNDPCYCVVEADEYDRSFLHLEPEIAIITATDADHLDIYGGHEALKQSFSEFASRIKPGGSLISKTTTGITGKPGEGYRTYSYALDEAGTFHASNVRIEDHQYHFDFVHPDGTIRDLIAGLPGRFNLENAVAALAAGYLMGISTDDLRKAVSTYQGVCRRFDIRINRPDLVYIDDYAHHPEELRACILAVKELYPGRKVTGIFQPHLYTRTRDFAPEFSKSLSLLDEVLLLDIYPAREEPIAGVSSEMLMDSITSGYKKLITKAEVPETLAQMRPELLLTLGAGDIDQLAVPIIEILGGPNET